MESTTLLILIEPCGRSIRKIEVIGVTGISRILMVMMMGAGLQTQVSHGQGRRKS
jgi:hypothetical protein